MATADTSQTAQPARPAQTSTGPGGKTEFDPSANVLALVDAAVKRLDDLRTSENRRIDDLREAGLSRTSELAAVRADHSTQLAIAESKRIDAIRAVDVNAASIANERAVAQAAVLATQLTASAEVLRGLVAAAALGQQQQMTQMTTQFTERLAVLERSLYEGIGKGRVADPMMEQLVKEMQSLRDSRSSAQGSTSGMKDMAGWIVAGATVIVAMAGFVATKL